MEFCLIKKGDESIIYFDPIFLKILYSNIAHPIPKEKLSKAVEKCLKKIEEESSRSDDTSEKGDNENVSHRETH